MPAIAAKAAVLQVSTTVGGAGTYSTVLGIRAPTITLDGALLDVTELPATFMARIQGLKDAVVEGSGTYQSADTTGQAAIRSSWLNDTELWYKFLPSGASDGSGFKQQCRVSKFQVGAPIADSVGVSFTLQGTGVVTLV